MQKVLFGFFGVPTGYGLEWILTFASVANPSVQISVVKKDKPNTGGDFMISIEVEAIDELYRKAVSLDYKIHYPITNEPWGVRRFFVQDPNGVILNIVSHIQSSRS